MTLLMTVGVNEGELYTFDVGQEHKIKFEYKLVLGVHGEGDDGVW